MSFLINDFALKKSRKDNIYKESTFYMNENIHVICSLQSLLATLNILPSTCIYILWCYIFCLNYTQIVLLTSNFEIQYGFSLHLINSLFWRTGGARAPRLKICRGPRVALIRPCLIGIDVVEFS